MAVGAILGGAYSIGKGLGISLDDINPFGGSDCSDGSYAAQADMAEAISRYLSPEDMRQLVRNMDSDVPPNASDMALFYIGGRDCKHKNVGRNDQRFLDELPRLIQQRAQEQAAASNPTYTDSRPEGTPSMMAIGNGPWGVLGEPGVIIGAVLVGLIWFFGMRGAK